ncbi:ABC transporter permease [Nonomuraea sp. NPDC050556]|uniref:ABC transporter permease n=1 Tax=Nonomuraea sp. NPDC050556 TaxID=3364369 RepID=UPI0037AC9895
MSEQTAGVIHDIGYRHYDGPRLGRAYAVRALTVHSLRGIFGLGRRARSKIIPFFLAAIMLMVAVVSITMMALLKQRGVSYTGLAVFMQVVLAIFLAAQSPSVVAPDLRYRVLPLYLSRPVTVIEYVGAKLAAMTIAMYLMVAVPLTLTFIGELLVSAGGPTQGGALMEGLPTTLEGAPQTKEYVAAMVMALVLALLLASFGLALASFTPRRGLGVASVIAVYLLVSAVSTILYATMESMGNQSAGWAWLLNPFFLVDALQVWLFGTPASAPDSTYPGAAGPVAALAIIALIALGVAALILRYRKAASR